MSDGSPNLRSRLEALRAVNGAPLGTLRLARVEALERRAATQTGEVRQLLDARVAELLAELAREAPRPTELVDPADRARPNSALAELIRRFDRHGASRNASDRVRHDTPQVAAGDAGGTCTQADVDAGIASANIGSNASVAGHGAASASTGRPMSLQRAEHAAFEDIRRACADVRSRAQLREALASAPADAGPLNSVSLVHRALARMHALSPEYLEHFLAYVDAVSALEPLCGSVANLGENPPRTKSGSKRVAAKSRSRKA